MPDELSKGKMDRKRKSEHREHKKKKKKSSSKKKKRDASESSTSEEEIGGGGEAFELKLREQRLREKEERKVKQQRIKELETPEEKRARRLAKKMIKEDKKKKEMGWGEEYMGYSNVDNPFNDLHLTEAFIWKKKLEKDNKAKLPSTEIEKQRQSIVEKNKEELEKLKRGRAEREAMREELEMMKRDQELQQHQEWEQVEHQFRLAQAKQRTKIRIEKGRPKPIDLLARYINAEEEDEDLDIEMQEPYNYLKGLGIRDLEDLLEDIKVYQGLESGKNDDYWKDVGTIAEEELSKLRRLDPDSSEFLAADRRQSIHNAVSSDITATLKGKTYHQLALIETDILKKIKGGEEGVDIGFWETILGQLKSHMARARLKDRHQDTLKSKLAKLKQEQIKQEPADPEEPPPGPEPTRPFLSPELPPAPDDDAEWEERDVEANRKQLYSGGGYSPTYQKEEGVPAGVELLEAVEAQRRVQFARSSLGKTGVATSQNDAAMFAEAKKGMNDEEAVFAVEAPLQQKTYLWSDKYRPRKPRYFNRVHTGFEWNKYNQTHYDLDNPPPKIVQGYKFNIFYPDLLDPSIPPDFFLIPCDDDDFAVLKFRAGPPYEDIAFKVVNREWEVSHKRGYKCQFQNGIFQLWFHFKKYRYRR